MLGKAEAKKLLLSSSDLSRVKVSRRDPKTGKKREWILDCNPQSPSYGLPGVGAIGGNNPRPVSPPPLPGVGLFGGNNPPREPGLWLRDGDVIEVPEKP